jgi:hypothetical protein
MARLFNTAGPCKPEDHYMLPPERRIPEVRRFIEEKLYFVIHAPRQVGKTTCFLALADELQREGRYAALYVNIEPAQAAGANVELGISSVLYSIQSAAARQLPPELQPEPAQSFAAVPPTNRLAESLTRWAERSPLPVVLFVDEIDALLDETLIAVLRQIRGGYPGRPAHFPQSIALIGLRDVRDYKLRVRPDQDSLGSSSPFNIKVESLTIRNFTAEEVAELYEQHHKETGQRFEPEALELAWHLTRGQPWLVNALARQAVEKQVPDRSVPITARDLELAKEALIERRDTHLDSLIERLREPRVRRIIEPIVAGESIFGDRIEDDAAFVEDLGLVERQLGQALRIANPIYHEVIPRALAFGTQIGIPHETRWYVRPDGNLDLDGLLEAFVGFWKQRAEALLAAQPYHEAAPHLVLMAFLQRIVNGGGFIDREYAVGSGRMDLCLRWPHPGGVQREAIEIKVWRDKQADPLHEGLEQLSAYLARLGLDHGVLVLFDRRAQAPPPSERCSRQQLQHAGRAIAVFRL